MARGLVPQMREAIRRTREALPFGNEAGRADRPPEAIRPRTGFEPVRVCTYTLPSYAASGDRLTASSNGALTAIDGVALEVGDRLFYLKPGSGVNGVYEVIQLGGASSPWILEKAWDCYQETDFVRGYTVAVAQGTNYKGLLWRLDTTGAIGTSNWSPILNEFRFVRVTGEYSGSTDYYEGVRIGYDGPEATSEFHTVCEGARIRAVNYNNNELDNHLRLAAGVIYAAKMLNQAWDDQGRFIYVVAPTLPVFHGAVVIAVQCTSGYVQWVTNGPAGGGTNYPVDDTDQFFSCARADELIAPYDGMYRIEANVFTSNAGTAGLKSISLSSDSVNGLGNSVGVVASADALANRPVGLVATMTRYLAAGDAVWLYVEGFNAPNVYFTATMSIQWLGMPANGRVGTAVFCAPSYLYGCTGGGSGSGGLGGGTDCSIGNCGDSGVPATITATVTDKVGCFADLPDIIDFECHDSGDPPNGHHDYLSATVFEACGFTNVTLGFFGTAGNTTPVLLFVGGSGFIFAEDGWTCDPFSAVFLVDDGAGNSCTITITE